MVRLAERFTVPRKRHGPTDTRRMQISALAKVDSPTKGRVLHGIHERKQQEVEHDAIQRLKLFLKEMQNRD